MMEELMKQSSGQMIDVTGSSGQALYPHPHLHLHPDFQVSNSSSELERLVEVRLEELSAAARGN